MSSFRIGATTIERVCVVGGGNVGHYLLATLGSNHWLSVSLLTSEPLLFEGRIESHDVAHDVSTVGNIGRASADPEDVIVEADMVLFAVPSNAYVALIDRITPHVKPGAIIGFIPGTGGAEFLARDFLERGCALFGSQRVPSGTRLIEKGSLVESLGNRRDLRIAAIPGRLTKDVCSFFEAAMGILTVPLPNYLSVTLTPSNPILHTSRLYGLFGNYSQGDTWSDRLPFYSNWDNRSSEILLGCDGELRQLCNALRELDLSGVKLLRDHYEIDREASGLNDVEKMTNKIRQLVYLKDYAPMRMLDDGGWVPDFSSRYFVEDFPYGLCILRDFCATCGVDTPYMDEVLGWAKQHIDMDFRKLPIPSNYGIESLGAIYEYYAGLESLFPHEGNNR